MLGIIKKNKVKSLLNSGSYTFQLMKEKLENSIRYTYNDKNENANIINSTDREPNIEKWMHTSRLLATKNPSEVQL